MSRLRPMLRCGVWMEAVVVAAFGADLGTLDAFVTGQMKGADVPGIAVAVVQDGRVVYAKAFGVADVETRAPLTTDHLFRIGSTTKMIAAAAVLSLLAAGIGPFAGVAGRDGRISYLHSEMRTMFRTRD